MNLNPATDLPDRIVVDAIDDEVVDGIPAMAVQNVNTADNQLWPGAGDNGSAERQLARVYKALAGSVERMLPRAEQGFNRFAGAWRRERNAK